MLKHSVNFGHNLLIDIFCTNYAHDRHREQNTVGLANGSAKLCKTVYKMISTNMKNRKDELLENLICHAKQTAMDGTVI
jgi:hypothetical protein